MIIRGLDYLRPSGISKSLSESLETQYKDNLFLSSCIDSSSTYIYIYINMIDEYNILYHITLTHMT